MPERCSVTCAHVSKWLKCICVSSFWTQPNLMLHLRSLRAQASSRLAPRSITANLSPRSAKVLSHSIFTNNLSSRRDHLKQTQQCGSFLLVHMFVLRTHAMLSSLCYVAQKRSNPQTPALSPSYHHSDSITPPSNALANNTPLTLSLLVNQIANVFKWLHSFLASSFSSSNPASSKVSVSCTPVVSIFL
jgi:hypothetical protein